MRKSFAGAAPELTLTSAALSTDTTLNVTNVTNYPNATIGPFVIVINNGGATEEKVLIESYTSSSMTVAPGGRGYDGTLAVAHNVGETVNACIDSITINEANLLANTLGTVQPTNLIPGNTASGGTSMTGAAADHVHGMPAWGSTQNISLLDATSSAGGSSGQIADAAHVHGLGNLLPSGMLAPFAGINAPQGWLICNGALISRTTYASLFAAIGTTYGAGDGSTTFALPDLQGRIPVGVSALGTNTQPTMNLAETGGEAVHVLVDSEVAPHSHGGATGTESAQHAHTDSGHGHGVSDPQHYHSTADNNEYVTGRSSPIGLVSTTTNQMAFVGADTAKSPTFISINTGSAAIGSESASHTHAINYDGGGQGHNNMQPYIGMYWIIKE